MNYNIARVIFVAFFVAGLGGCQTVFDYGPPKVDTPLSTVITVADAADYARKYKEKYLDWAQSVGASIQVFELPILGLGIASGANLAGLGVTKNALTQMLVSGGGIAATENYYAPRARRDIYVAGYEAMACVESVADADVALLKGRPAAFDTLSLAGGTGASSDNVRLVLNAIDSINLRMLIRGTNTSSQPDASKIADDIKKAAERRADLRQRLLSTPTISAMDHLTAFGELDTLAPAIDFETDLKACVAKAG